MKDQSSAQGKGSNFSVLAWLEGLNLKQYYDAFLDEGYDQFDAIVDITEDELANTLNVKKGHVKVLLKNLPTAPKAKKEPKTPTKKKDPPATTQATKPKAITQAPQAQQQYGVAPAMMSQQMVRAPVYAMHRPPLPQKLAAIEGPKKRGRKKRSDTPVAIQSTYIHPSEHPQRPPQGVPRYMPYPPNVAPPRVDGQRRGLEPSQSTVRLYMQQNGVPVPQQYPYSMIMDKRNVPAAAEKPEAPPVAKKRGRRPRCTTIDLKPINHGSLAPAPPHGARVMALAPGQIPPGQPYGPMMSHYQQYGQPRAFYPPPQPPLPPSQPKKLSAAKAKRTGQSIPAAPPITSIATSPPLPPPQKVRAITAAPTATATADAQASGTDTHRPPSSNDNSTRPSTHPHPTTQTAEFHHAAMAAKLSQDTDLATAQAVMALTNGPDALAVPTGMPMEL
ncbi:hypothetical protein SARC_05220 [Sphaeroforma arctica JP610]|uniref:SAM domain-containing protein n=1 Tax=Sphaeroforma arctica JP610 TaxID=667725 RepID=A0A0L0G0X3_9EUKA|nr:hypothetical protein SARC_05220 [Sphaeroforma arctica JP610]KNC82494.1 hypothetical protein SARC_05220 [Sphaeroforma arctica JP610]|eukprot:XP_014156396.1 hypothetical protein SARC_05220 [Sphaeroforma arctica JP610]